MNGGITEKLRLLPAPIRVAVAGAGEFGLQLITQASGIHNMEVSVVADINPEAAIRAYKAAGFRRDDIVVADSATQARKHMRRGKKVVLEDAMAAAETPVDVVCDATGDPGFGAEFAYRAIRGGKHVVAVNAESAVVVGSYLRRLADEAGVVYTLADGDQPSLINGLYEWAWALGLRTIVAGKWAHVRPDIPVRPVARRTIASSADGSKDQVEMCCVANTTGLTPDVRGMHKPSLRLREIPDVFRLAEEGGILRKEGVVDMVNCLSPDGRTELEPMLGGGVFLLVTSDNPQFRYVVKNKGVLCGKDGRAALVYRPFHLVGIEAPMSILKAALYKEPTAAPLATPVADVIAIAKRDLRAGEVLDGIGGRTVKGLVEDIHVARRRRLLPLGLAENVRLKHPVPAGGEITYDSLEQPGDTFIWKLRRLQDSSM